MTPEVLTALIDATWPAAAITRAGGFAIRAGEGGGSRVSAATALAPGTGDIEAAEAAIAQLGQSPLFMVRAGEEALDSDLEARGYAIKDPVTAYAAPIAAMTATKAPHMTTVETATRMAIQEEIWAAGGIGPARLAIMDRAQGPKTTILGRAGDRPAGTLFAAVHDGVAVLHAIETLPKFRRGGVGRNMMTTAAHWATAQGATRVALLVTDANAGARSLYASLGMTAEAGYHYRIKDQI